MEIEAVNRKANAGLTTGIIGTVGAGLPILQSLLGGCGNNANTNKECSNDHSISRYDAAMMGQISKLEQENAILKSENFTNEKFAAFNDAMNSRFRNIEAQLAQQAVVNAQVAANLSCTQQTVAVLQGLTKTVVPIDSICPQPAVATAAAGA